MAAGFPAVKAFCWFAAAAPRVPRAFAGALASCAEPPALGAGIHRVPPPRQDRARCGAAQPGPEPPPELPPRAHCHSDFDFVSDNREG